EEPGREPDENEPHSRIVRAVSADLLARLAEDPARAAILLDVDGTLAPIVPRPEDARVPDDARAEVSRLAARYALLACISGRTRAPRSGTSWTTRGSSARSTRATTRPTSTPSTPSAASSWPFAWRFRPTRRPRSSRGTLTSWSARPGSWSTCCGGSD